MGRRTPTKEKSTPARKETSEGGEGDRKQETHHDASLSADVSIASSFSLVTNTLGIAVLVCTIAIAIAILMTSSIPKTASISMGTSLSGMRNLFGGSVSGSGSGDSGSASASGGSASGGGAAEWDLFAARSRVPLRMVSVEELSMQKGTDKGAVWVGIAGIAVDVSNGGRRIYGPGGAYAHFAGRDGTRAFATGDYSAEGLRASVAGLGARDLRAVAEWVSFYLHHPTYLPIGRIPGEFYASDGTPRPSALDSALAPQPDPVPYPGCNSRWAGPTPAHPNGHGAVWCTHRSGAHPDAPPRSWVGVPRRFRYIDPDDLRPTRPIDPDANDSDLQPLPQDLDSSSQDLHSLHQDLQPLVRTRCVCVPSHREAAADSRLAQYPGCPEDAVECPT